MNLRKKNRWGRVSELDRRFRVGSPGYNSYPNRLKHLHSWRTMHAIAGSHTPIQMHGTRLRIRPSSNLPLRKKEAYVKKNG